MAIQGIQRVRMNTQALIKQITGPTTETAVYALLSQGAALAQTMVPIDTSTLINSQYAPQIQQTPGKTEGYVGYTAEYAANVHEAPGTLAGQPRQSGNGNYWGPMGEPGFLAKGMEQMIPAAPGVLRSIYRV